MFDSQLTHMVTFGMLNITMIRNANGPEFNATQYIFNLEWRDQPGIVIGRIFASDRDGVSYFLIFTFSVSESKT